MKKKRIIGVLLVLAMVVSIFAPVQAKNQWKVHANTIKLKKVKSCDGIRVSWKKVKGAKGYEVKIVDMETGERRAGKGYVGNMKHPRYTFEDWEFDLEEGEYFWFTAFVRCYKLDSTGDKIYSKWVESPTCMCYYRLLSED